MSKLKEAQNSIEVLAGQLVAVQMLLECVMAEGIRTKAFDEQTMTPILDKGILAVKNNGNMNDHESFGAIGVLTSAADTLKQAKTLELFDRHR